MTEIVIVDDRVTNRNILQRLSALLEPDATINSFSEPVSAIERIAAHPTDLVITDYKMPGMNGAEFIKYCRTRVANFDAPIIVVTAYEDREFRYEALEAGATDFLMSPIDNREFSNRVRNVLAMHRQARQLRVRAASLESELDTSLLQHAETVERNEKRLRSIVDSNPNFIFATSATGIVTMSNAAFASACGLPVKAMVDRPLRHVIQDSFFAERMLLDDAEVRTRHSALRSEIRFTPALGSDIYMQVSKTTITGPNTDGTEVLTVLTDITQRRAAEEMLATAKRVAEAANAAKSDFLANMSHELRTPLNAVIGFAELIQKDINGTAQPQHAEYCGYIIDGGRHLLSIISDVLDMAQIEAGKMRLVETEVDIDALLADSRRLLHGSAQNSKSRLAVGDCSELPLVFGDEAKLRQVLVNVADNALKFSHPGGVVTIDARIIPGGSLVIEVRDSGVGMTDEEIEIAFSRFGRIGPAVLSHPGTGLGLPLSADLVRLHGGNLVIESQPRVGTLVRITLPPERVLSGLQRRTSCQAG